MGGPDDIARSSITEAPLFDTRQGVGVDPTGEVLNAVPGLTVESKGGMTVLQYTSQRDGETMKDVLRAYAENVLGTNTSSERKEYFTNALYEQLKKTGAVGIDDSFSSGQQVIFHFSDEDVTNIWKGVPFPSPEGVGPESSASGILDILKEQELPEGWRAPSQLPAVAGIMGVGVAGKNVAEKVIKMLKRRMKNSKETRAGNKLIVDVWRDLEERFPAQERVVSMESIRSMSAQDFFGRSYGGDNSQIRQLRAATKRWRQRMIKTYKKATGEKDLPKVRRGEDVGMYLVRMVESMEDAEQRKSRAQQGEKRAA